MHPKNPYSDRPPNFDELAAQYPTFQPFVTHTGSGKPCIDFKNPAALRELTRSLLKKDFDLDVVLPEDRLCPTLANRYAFVLLCAEIILEIQDGDYSAERKLKVLDIKDAQIWATELNEDSYQSASRTLERNQLFTPRINLVKVKHEDTPLLDLIAAVDAQKGDQPFTFTVCNPPFYSSAEEMQQSTALKALPTYAAPTAAANELVTAGGEVAFIGRMIRESVRTKEKCLWYTSLIGKASSISLLVDLLRQEKIAAIVSEALRDAGIEVAWEGLRRDVSATSRQREDGIAGTQEGEGCSIEPTHISWTRAARRKRQQEPATAPNPSLFHARIRIKELEVEATLRPGSPSREADKGDVGALQVSLHWARGRERTVVESLWAFLVRKIGDAVRLAEQA
ncbi:hypothetical protein QFC21_001155 [Naganishia friedmannii]|uniref:Uncharacterized protein n=1 Tax=Naganishia friedmannii TaxID=89922 RepID=A0ACC2W7E1_9TREE|nr:hypothetical protein QFC21_001155 [Naganishia friedmannii]